MPQGDSLEGAAADVGHAVDNHLHHIVSSTAAFAWRTEGCTVLVAACTHSTADTVHTEQDRP